MLTLYLGALGSGKTSNAVRYMLIDDSGLKTYTNIVLLKKNKHVFFKNPATIIKSEKYTVGKKEKVNYSFNSDEWLKLKKPLNLVWDEIHFIADSRNTQSAMNKVTTEFISMARRIVGFDKYGYGDFILIAQNIRTMDVRIRELVTTIIYHIMHWIVECDNCHWLKRWDSEKPNLKTCPSCHSRTLLRSDFCSERLYFKTISTFMDWFVNEEGKPYFKEFITDISNYFTAYDTLQYIKYEMYEKQ